MQTPKTFFLHGLDSSSQGTKGRFFADNFPGLVSPDFKGDLAERLRVLETLCLNENDITFIGSSFGGLMAACFTIRHPEKVTNLILLAPALNYGEYRPPKKMLPTPTILIVGKHDTVTPADKIIPLAKKTFVNLEIRIEADDHMLHNSFKQLDWRKLLEEVGN